MNNRLEQFVRDHREEFDEEEPGKKVWEEIRFNIEPGKQRPSDESKNVDPSGDGHPTKNILTIIRLNGTRLSAAAAIIAVMAGSIWFFKHKDDARSNTIASAQKPAATPGQEQPPTQTPSATTPSREEGSKSGEVGQAGPDIAQASGDTRKKESPAVAEDPNATINEEMYHYARLVELKHKELKVIEKDEPLLYNQFAADVHNLDSVYQSLQKQLPKNPNREQLLEAMLQNLQLQMGLLNHQLDIIKQINHSKKTAYEKAYKTA